ncbi:MAG: hypothetical protein GWP19_09340 [Planctomycetia bacterium]|nr:hypothetical protein [Planctomycetia bacterium]
MNQKGNYKINGVLNDFRSHHKQMRIFAYEKYRKSRDIISIAYSVFKLEQINRKNKLRNVEIGRFVDEHYGELEDILTELISYVLLEKINIDFYNSKNKFYQKKLKEKNNLKTDAIVLFSGGIDSLAGIHWAKEYFNHITGVFCAHADQAWTIHTVNELSSILFNKYNIEIKTIHVPEMQKGGYSQLRGFLYILAAGAWLDIYNTDTIVLSECGPTIYQPRFGPYDSVTMTTHPVVVEAAKSVLEIILKRKINIYTPFENMTKSEVISYIPNDVNISNTHSCITSRFGTHDGTCYGCVIRKLGTIGTNRIDTNYNKNPLIDDTANMDNLLSLLMYSQDILLDYDSMPLYQIEKIESYNKQDLFRRFALDNFAAIYLMNKKGIKPTSVVQQLYNDYINICGESDLENRVRKLKDTNYLINEKIL